MMFNAVVDATHVKGSSRFLVCNRHIQASSLMTCWITVAKFIK